eukprot:TRINITY_DN29366_c0_g2_i3.p2 TRINITY_DN29366_c0_g2~~TRINITY_DN29366_c0_g2_i3.p2  ORF type:complete len:117 (+),score=5.83 TRINITY_DN29366_c0_g2_i3:641-991(+)
MSIISWIVEYKNPRSKKFWTLLIIGLNAFIYTGRAVSNVGFIFMCMFGIQEFELESQYAAANNFANDYFEKIIVYFKTFLGRSGIFHTPAFFNSSSKQRSFRSISSARLTSLTKFR